ncbi:hypothetical protein EV360DRAFT_85726 [Lentinula raphanica]|nr:hypothetical protein EV360DRAFT_85726 [Lentinula raphanica]
MSQTPQTTTSSRNPSSVSMNTSSTSRKPTNEDLLQFYIAVRDKNEWERKVWDDELVLRWAKEAEILPLDSTMLQGEAAEVIHELRRRSQIRKYDQEIVPDAGRDSSKHRRPVGDINDDFKNALKYARGSKYALHEPELREKGLGVFVSDGLVPDSVHQELVHELDALAANEPKDFHPHSFGKVQDLIHPSLYPYVAGVSSVLPGVKLPPVDVDNKFRTEIGTLDKNDMASAFAWIPSIFKVSPDGTDVQIQSYINGLDVLALSTTLREDHANKRGVPPQDFTVSRTMDVTSVSVTGNEFVLTREMWNEFLASRASTWDAQKREENAEKEKMMEDILQEKMRKENFHELGDEFVASEVYKGQQLKVIVKAANYTLSPGREYEGSWHMEGMPHERIVASVIYYYETDEAIEDRGLSFRKFRDPTNDFPNVEDSHYRHEDFLIELSKANAGNDEDEERVVEDEEYNYPSDWETEVDYEGNERPVNTTEIPVFIARGTVPTTNSDSRMGKTTGRMISFPNWLQHKVELVKNKASAGNAVARRKILCFFLVDDSVQNETWILRPGFVLTGLRDMNVLTTSEVPNQMRKTNEPTIRALLPSISMALTGKELPPELVEIIRQYAFAGTFSREEAEQYRLELMSDRKIKTQRRYGFGQTYSLCEH